MNKKVQRKSVPRWVWFAAAILAVFLAAPNGMIMKVAAADIPALWINVIRFATIVIVMAPLIIKAIPAMTRKNVRYALLSGLMMALAVTGYVTAIAMSQASYVAVVDLAIPIILMVYSVYFTREKVSRKAVIGISIAALGAFIVIGVPLLVGQGFATDFHPLATVFALLNCVTFPMTVILSRKAHEHGLSLPATFGLSSFVVMVVSLFIALVAGVPAPVEALTDNPSILLPVIYSALAVSLLARLLTVAAYQHLGSVAVSGLHYIEGFFSIILPIVILGEFMTIEMVIGGLVILVGVIVAEMRFHPLMHAHRRGGHRHV